MKSTRAIKLAKNSERVAAIAVKGMFENKTEVVPGLNNKLSKFLVRLAPKSLSEKSAAIIYDV